MCHTRDMRKYDCHRSDSGGRIEWLVVEVFPDGRTQVLSAFVNQRDAEATSEHLNERLPSNGRSTGRGYQAVPETPAKPQPKLPETKIGLDLG
jgi:hypothetical protein